MAVLFDLLERDGSTLAVLNPHSATLTQRLNTYASLTMSLRYTAEVQNQLDQLGIGRVLRAWVDETLRFAGPIHRITEQGNASRFDEVIVEANDPFYVLHHTYQSRFDYTAWTATDAGVIANDIIEGANGDISGAALPHQNTLLDQDPSPDTSVNRDRSFGDDSPSAGQIIENLAAAENGFYFAVLPIDSGSTVTTYRCGELDIRYPNPGVTSGARFEYGPETSANCETFRVETKHPTQAPRFHGTGVIGTGSESANDRNDSYDDYGWWESRESDPSVVRQDTADEKAVEMETLQPTTTYAFTVARGADNAPSPWTDFKVGDSVELYAVLPLTTVDGTIHVTSMIVQFDTEGFYMSDIVVEDLS